MNPILRERCGLLKQAWYAVALSSQVKGRPVSRTILEELLVVYRDSAGQAHVLADRCPHRNALLSTGRVHGDNIECPYHGWTFDGQGQCTKVPSEGKGTPARPRRTESFPVRESDGLVWAWMGGSKFAPNCHPFSMPFRDNSEFRSYYMETLFDSDVTNLVENFMDVPHTVFVHSGWFRSRRQLRVPIVVERTSEAVFITYQQQLDSIGWSERLINPKRLPLAHTDRFYMPNTTRVDYVYGDLQRVFTITSTCTPISDRTTRVFTLISFKLGGFGKVAQWLLPWYTRRVIQQDVDIMGVQNRALSHYGGTHFASTPADTPHLYIESLRRWAEEGGSAPRPQPVKTELELWI